MKKRLSASIGVLLALVAVFLFIRIGTRWGASNPNSFQISYLDSNGEGSPKKADWAVPRDEDEAFLGGVLANVLEGEEGLSDEAKSIRILKYVSSSLVHKANQGSATTIIHDGFALCGGKSYVFVALCRKAGMAARYAGSMYMPGLSSHAISETFYAGKWHLYDPTFGMFFYSKPDYDNTGYVISFHDLVSNSYGWTPFKVVLKPGTGRYDESVRGFAITKAERDYLAEDDEASVDSYRKDLDEAYPIAYGSDDIVSYPVDANLLDNSSQWFGQVDDKDGELATYAVRFSGSHYVGNGVPPAFHTWVVKAAPHTIVRIEYYSVIPNPPKLRLVPLRAAKVVESKYENEKVTFTVYINDSEAVLSVYCPDASFDVDAMHIYR